MLEYEEAARNLAQGAGYSLIVHGSVYAPCYPFGFSYLLVPSLWAWDKGPGSGVFLVVAMSLLAILLTWRLGYVVGGGIGAAVGALLLAVSPAHVQWSQAVMSDVPASAVTPALALAVVGASRAAPRAARWLIVGLLTGLAAALRLTTLLMLVPAGVSMDSEKRGDLIRVSASV